MSITVKSILNDIKEHFGILIPSNIITNNERQLLLAASNDNSQDDNNNICLANELSLQSNTEKEIAELEQRAVIRIRKQELIKQKNLEQVLSKTEDILENEQTQSKENLSESINEDWLSHYIEGASKISDEQVQELWAKILAGEIITPKTFSKRTLDVLLRLSPEEAKLFEKVCGYVVEISNNMILMNEDKLNAKYPYSEIMHLDECGLINSSGTNSINMTINPSDKLAIIYGQDAIIGQSKKQENVRLQIFPLTVAGTELLKITSPNRNYNYMQNLINHLKNKYKNIEWEMHQAFKYEGKTYYVKINISRMKMQ